MQPTAGELGEEAVWSSRSADIDGAFETLRAHGGPVFISESDPGNTNGDYWVVARHADISEVSRRSRDFSSAVATAMGTTVDDVPPDVLESTASFIAMDEPRHTRLRRIVSRAFTPAALDRLNSDVEQIASEVIRGIRDRGSCDFVEDVAARVPAQVIMRMMGIPSSEEATILHSANQILSAFEPEYIPDQTDQGRLEALSAAFAELTAIATDLASDRINNPRDDLVTILMTQGVGEDVLTPAEMTAFFYLLVEAGSETTRNALAHGLLALAQDPQQRTTWQSDFDSTSPRVVDEILRWASPVLHMRRVVTADNVRLGDAIMSEGDRVVMWYYSGNRDPAVFEDPSRFDSTRHPNEHLSFGAPGIHFCLGAHLARREITAVFKEVFAQLPDLEVSGPPEWLNSCFLNGIKHLPVTYSPV